MKKSLMVLGFALCATFAFAQTNKSVDTRVIDKTTATKSAAIEVRDAGYNGSIFTKDGDVLFSCDFSQENVGYTTGKVVAGDVIGGATASPHAQSFQHSLWTRLADTSEASAVAIATNYPDQFPVSFVAGELYLYNSWYKDFFKSPTANAGVMVSTMHDQITGWGGTGTIGDFNSYIAFSSFATTGVSQVDVEFYELVRKFYDEEYIDYSSDGGATWNTVEINVGYVDVNVNSYYLGMYRKTLPRSVGNKADVRLRLRYYSNWGEDHGAYGYFWMVDDFTVKASPAERLVVSSQSYFEGFYQLMPKDFSVPVVWADEFQNTGTTSQNVTGSVYTYAQGAAPSLLVSNTMNNAVDNPDTTYTLSIDPLGWYSGSGFGYWPSNETTPASTKAYLPTTNTGKGHWFSNMTYGSNTTAFDTMVYTTNWDASWKNGRGVWGRDHGNIRKFSYFAAGMVGASTFSTSPSETLWNKAGYGVAVSYITGENVPNDWRILGVEIVPSTREGMRQAGAMIVPTLYWDSLFEGTNGVSLYFMNIDHGAGVHEVLPSEMTTGSAFEDLTYSEFGNYPTVFIPFPNQPKLQPKTSYRIGYELAEDANFAVSTCSNYYYSLADSTGVAFAEDENTVDYSSVQHIDNYYTTAITDSYDNRIHFFMVDDYPMIRMVVGPSYYIPKHTFTYECGDNGQILRNNVNVCGTSDTTIVEGSSVSIIAYPEDEEEYRIDKIYVDGTPVDFELIEDSEEDGGAIYGRLTISNITANHTIRATFTTKNGSGSVDPVASGITMKLQPNPATSNVRISLKGVSGMVDLALIDMSGRVINTTQFNAENGANINVSDLAKGAYFVRITNNKISKVEKLIVR